jgi:glycine/D-amino acid oxidase-like deaminating enzyme
VLADRLSGHGLKVILVDSRRVGLGSTAASTALLQYDLDVPLHPLITMLGERNAHRAFLLGVEAIEEWQSVCSSLGCCYESRPSLFFAQNSRTCSELEAEYFSRARLGLNVEWISHERLLEVWGLDVACAIRSQQAGQMDPFAVTQALLSRAIHGGCMVFERTRVTGEKAAPTGTLLETDQGPEIFARHVAYAAGYEAAHLLPKQAVTLQSTFAIATPPIQSNHAKWHDRSMAWEYADPYLYARWDGERLLIGGADVPFVDEDSRDQLIAKKAHELVQRFRRIAPFLEDWLEPAMAWTGTFGTTRDGLGYAGPLPSRPGVFVALGFGGNGITLALAAARVVANLILGLPDRDAELLSVNRSKSLAPV